MCEICPQNFINHWNINIIESRHKLAILGWQYTNGKKAEIISEKHWLRRSNIIFDEFHLFV